MEIVDYIFSKAYELLFMAILVIEVLHVFVFSPRREARREEELDRLIFGEEKEEKKKKSKES